MIQFLSLFLSCVVATVVGGDGEDEPFRRELSFRLQSKHLFQSFSAFEDVIDDTFESMTDSLGPIASDADMGSYPCYDIPWWQGSFFCRCADLVQHVTAYPSTPEEKKSLEHGDEELQNAFLDLQQKYDKDYLMDWICSPHYPLDLVTMSFHVKLVDDPQRNKQPPDSPLQVAVEMVAEAIWQALMKDLPRSSGSCSWGCSPNDVETTALVEIYTNDFDDSENDQTRAIVVSAIETTNANEDWFTVHIVDDETFLVPPFSVHGVERVKRRTLQRGTVCSHTIPLVPKAT